MKHSTPQLLKFQRLQRRLGETKRGLVGLLELLWHGTATQAPQGDIGKFSNEEIAILVDWEGDYDQLVDALVDTGWLDRCSRHRLVVHDWGQHAPNWVRMLVKKRELSFSEASAEASTERSAEASQEASTEASADGTPNLTKPNLTIPNQTNTQQDRPADLSRQRKRTTFVRPSKDDVAAYAAEMGFDLDAQAFVDFYDAKGWVVGRHKMTDWRAAVRNAVRAGWANPQRAGPQDRKVKQVFSLKDALQSSGGHIDGH